DAAQLSGGLCGLSAGALSAHRPRPDHGPRLRRVLSRIGRRARTAQHDARRAHAGAVVRSDGMALRRGYEPDRLWSGVWKRANAILVARQIPATECGACRSATSPRRGEVDFRTKGGSRVKGLLNYQESRTPSPHPSPNRTRVYRVRSFIRWPKSDRSDFGWGEEADRARRRTG